MATEIDVLVLGNVVLHKHEQLRSPAVAKLDDPLFPESLLGCMRPPSEQGRSLERVSGGFRCPETHAFFPDRDGVPSLFKEVDNDADDITASVKTFYEENPFPNYEGLEDFGSLVSRGQKTDFSRALLAAIGCNKSILECGCGTGQMSHFLSLNNNHVLGVDLSLSSLKLAIHHKLRNDRNRAAFVQMNIFDLAIRDAVFDVVISTGVLHHTKDPKRAFAAIVRKAKPGGIIVVGVYNRYARIPSAVRSKLLPMVGPKIDYVARTRIRDKRKAQIWIEDQYFNPHETWHSIDEIIDWFRDNGVTYLNCWPALVGFGDERLFCETETGSRARRLATQWSWLANNSREGGLFVATGRRNLSNPDGRAHAHARERQPK
jgi:SAM-dependent methyltransferase